MVGAFDTAVGTADVRVLASIVLDVRALDRYAEDGAVLEFDVEVTFAVRRLVVLRDLVVTRHVRIEVVLAGELAPLVDLAVQREAELDRVVDGGRVDDRQRTRQAEAHRRQLGVRLGAEGDRRRAEQLRVRRQLDVRLETDDRIELLDGFGILHQFFSHNILFLSPLLVESIEPRRLE